MENSINMKFEDNLMSVWANNEEETVQPSTPAADINQNQQPRPQRPGPVSLFSFFKIIINKIINSITIC